MAYTVGAAFDSFFDAINLSGDFRQIANARKNHLAGLLGKRFEILDAFPMGSIPRYTALRTGDLDILVVLHWGNHIKGKLPSQVLKDFRDFLAEYKPRVRRNGQAVTLTYTTWPNVDIVPASRVTDDYGNVSHYNIPDMHSESWLKSNPPRHSENIRTAVSLCGETFRKVIKIAKYWNATHGDYLQSYHVEVMALKTFAYQPTDLATAVETFFGSAASLVRLNLENEGQLVDSYLSWSDRNEAARRLDAVRQKIAEGRVMNVLSPYGEAHAISAWHQVFGKAFPTYG